MRIAIETGTHSPWVSRLLEQCGHEVLVANSRKLRLIYANKRKTDEVDAENLARLARVDPKLLYPLKHRGESSQAHMAIVRSREALVGSRAQLVNPGFGERSSPIDEDDAYIKVPLDPRKPLGRRREYNPLLVRGLFLEFAELAEGGEITQDDWLD